MSTIRVSGDTSGYYDLTVPAAAGTNSIDLSTLVTNNHTGNVTLNGALTQTKSGDSQLKVISTSNNTFAQVLIQDANAGYSWQVRSDGAQSTPTGSFLLNDQRGTFPIIIEENNPSNTLRLANGYVTTPSRPSFLMKKYTGGSTAIANNTVWTYDQALTNVGGHANISNGRFTAPVAGSYCFMWHNIGESSSAVYRSFIRYNASSTWGSGSYRLESRNYHSQGYPNASAQVVVYLNASDYVDIYVTGGSIYSDTTNGVWFCGFLIG